MVRDIFPSYFEGYFDSIGRSVYEKVDVGPRTTQLSYHNFI